MAKTISAWAGKNRRTPKTVTPFYRVVADQFSCGEIEAIVQTDNPADFATFEEAQDAAVEAITGRIYEEGGDPDDEDYDTHCETYLDELLDKLNLTWGCEDWSDYLSAISQPFASVEKRGRLTNLKLTDLAERRRYEKLPKKHKTEINEETYRHVMGLLS